MAIAPHPEHNLEEAVALADDPVAAIVLCSCDGYKREGRMDLRDVDAVLLDTDGTPVDSDAAVERAWTAWAAEYGVDAAAAVVTA